MRRPLTAVLLQVWQLPQNLVGLVFGWFLKGKRCHCNLPGIPDDIRVVSAANMYGPSIFWSSESLRSCGLSGGIPAAPPAITPSIPNVGRTAWAGCKDDIGAEARQAASNHFPRAMRTRKMVPRKVSSTAMAIQKPTRP